MHHYPYFSGLCELIALRAELCDFASVHNSRIPVNRISSAIDQLEATVGDFLDL